MMMCGRGCLRMLNVEGEGLAPPDVVFLHAWQAWRRCAGQNLNRQGSVKFAEVARFVMLNAFP
jgi:hypothetical protein